MNPLKSGLTVLALAAAGGLLAVGEPSLEDRLAAAAPLLDARLAAGTVTVPPEELRELIYFANFGLQLLDLRAENEFGLFHLPLSQRITLDELGTRRAVLALPARTVTVLISNDGTDATRAWRALTALGAANVYVLEGGVHGWLRQYGPERLTRGSEATERRAYEFESARGARHPEADPGPPSEAERPQQHKVAPLGPAKRKAGGCG